MKKYQIGKLVRIQRAIPSADPSFISSCMRWSHPKPLPITAWWRACAQSMSPPGCTGLPGEAGAFYLRTLSFGWIGSGRSASPRMACPHGVIRF